MRTFIILSMFAASLAHAAWNEYEETRELELDASGINALEIEAGAGSLDVRGDPGVDKITVSALIQVPKKEAKALEVIESDMVLSLERSGERGVLKGFFDSGLMSWGGSPGIRLEVVMPSRFGLDIDDGSGSIVIKNVTGDIRVDDGSGSLRMSDVGGDIQIDDGSGSLMIETAGGDISVKDGSGSITIRGVRGSVVIDDGAGGINVSDVDEDLIIEDDGSGSLSFARIEGRVQKED